MRKLKTFRVFLESVESDEPIVKLDSVGSALGTETGNLWPLLANGSISWEDEVHWDETDWSFRQEMSAEDRAKVDAAMVSAEDYFADGVDMSLVDYLSDVLVSEELTDVGYQVTIQAAVWNHKGGQSYFSSGALLPTVFMRVMEEGRTEDKWIRDFRRDMEKVKSNFPSYGIGYLLTFGMRGGSVRASLERIPDEVAQAVKDRVAEEFPDVYLMVRQDVRSGVRSL